MSRKILVVGQLPPPVHGSTVMGERFMRALKNNGFETKIVQKTFSKKNEEVGKASLLKLMRVPGHCYRLLKTIRRFKPNLCIYFVTVGITALAVDALLIELLIRCRIPYVLYFHGKGYRKYALGSGKLKRFVVRKTLQRAAGGIVLGEGLKPDVSGYIPNERLFVLPNGIPDITIDVKEEHRNDGIVHVIFMSNLHQTKGPMEFLEMAKIVVDNTEQVRFTIAGSVVDEEFYKRLLNYKESEGLADYVEIPGPLFGKEKEALFMSADIFVFPTYKDTFPLVNLEAMQCGIPVISSNEGAIPDVIRDGVNGYIVDPKNVGQIAARVLELIQNPLLREVMGKAGRNLYKKHYSMDAYERNVKMAVNHFLSKTSGSDLSAGVEG